MKELSLLDGGFLPHEPERNLIKTEVSEYAKTSIEEFIARCWAEYKNSSEPRRIYE